MVIDIPTGPPAGRTLDLSLNDVTIGVLTALAEEFTAACEVLGAARPAFSSEGTPGPFGRLSRATRLPSRHPLVVGRSEMFGPACVLQARRPEMSGEAPPTTARDPGGRIRLDDSDWAFLKRLVFISLFGLLLYFAWLISDVLLLAFAAVLVAVMLRRLANAIADYTPVPRSWSVMVARCW